LERQEITLIGEGRRTSTPSSAAAGRILPKIVASLPLSVARIVNYSVNLQEAGGEQ
jgi:hypothetical protein